MGNSLSMERKRREREERESEEREKREERKKMKICEFVKLHDPNINFLFYRVEYCYIRYGNNALNSLYCFSKNEVIYMIYNAKDFQTYDYRYLYFTINLKNSDLRYFTHNEVINAIEKDLNISCGFYKENPKNEIMLNFNSFKIKICIRDYIDITNKINVFNNFPDKYKKIITNNEFENNIFHENTINVVNAATNAMAHAVVETVPTSTIETSVKTIPTAPIET